jgi:hypothetical protein
MSLHNFYLIPALTAVLLSASADALKAQPADTNVQTAPLVTEAVVVPGEIIGSEQIHRAFIKFGATEFMFIVPADILAQFTRECPVTLKSRKDNFTITMRLLNSLPAETTLKSAQKSWMETHYGPLQHVEEFSIPVEAREGAGMQFRQTPEPGVSRFVKTIWAPCEIGILEFTLFSDSKCAKNALLNFDAVITTFHSNAQGKIKIIPRSARS